MHEKTIISNNWASRVSFKTNLSYHFSQWSGDFIVTFWPMSIYLRPCFLISSTNQKVNEWLKGNHNKNRTTSQQRMWPIVTFFARLFDLGQTYLLLATNEWFCNATILWRMVSTWTWLLAPKDTLKTSNYLAHLQHLHNSHIQQYPTSMNVICVICPIPKTFAWQQDE